MLDAGVAASLTPLALVILVSGVDDLVLVVACCAFWIRNAILGVSAAAPLPASAIQQRIAIFVPLWHEHGVIGGMIEHNMACVRYNNHHFFIGAYPNDEPTLTVVRELETRFRNVHLAVCPHDGPTSKADCLNWVYQHMLLHEEIHDVRFDVIITHDAEDLMHPDSLRTINQYAGEYGMVQIPVLPLPTPLRDLTHGVYCDEFSEYQTKDMTARMILGGFIPSNGVGTGFARGAIEMLANEGNNRIFEPDCLTEDYENGLRLHRLGCKQIFVPLHKSERGFVATREFFPQRVKTAIKQRTRWVTGISLQSWERNGWNGNFKTLYWFWRDRKGLIGNPVGLLVNAIFVYGAATWTYAHATGAAWGLAARATHPGLLRNTLLLQAIHMTFRAACVGRIYGFVFALGVPVRVVLGNWINTAATLRAEYKYLRARLRHEPLVWSKTEHAYPSRNALLEHKRRLGEVLTGSSYITEYELEEALRTQPAGVRIGEHLVRLGKLTEDELYEALSLQQGLPSGYIESAGVNVDIARSLPLHVSRNCKVLPYKISAGMIFLASPELPTDELNRELRNFTRLTPRYQLVTPSHFEQLTLQLL